MPHEKTKSEQILLKIKKKNKSEKKDIIWNYVITTFFDFLIARVDNDDHQRNLEEVLFCLVESGLCLKRAGVCLRNLK